MNKKEIFTKIVEILNNDYAGFKTEHKNNFSKNYNVNDDMPESEFISVIQSYLLDFKDNHLSFVPKGQQMPHRGFKVRRSEEGLFVTSNTKEENLKLGDEITKIDGQTIYEIGKTNSKFLKSDIFERQNWNIVLEQSSTIEVNNSIELALSNYEKPEFNNECVFEKINSDTSYMKISSFLEAEPIIQILDNHGEEIESSKNLIIDVRQNNGGNDMFYFPLFPYIFPERIMATQIFGESEEMYTNYTKFNYENWIPRLKSYLEQPLPEEMADYINKVISVWDNNVGKGFVKNEDNLDDFEIEPKSGPEKIYILSDNSCGSAGESFVKLARRSDKVTVLGRATYGALDVNNIVEIDFEDYIFSYGISKVKDEFFTYGEGFAPDIYIPWTKEHINEDLDLKYVIENFT